MNKTNIQWTDYSSNPLGIKGSRSNYCVKVSLGCKHCYAEGMARRLAAISGDAQHYQYKAMAHPPEMELRMHVLDQWCAMKKPRKIFVGSMTDIFGEWVLDNWLFQIFDTMECLPHLTFQILTKRADRLREFVEAYCKEKKIDKLPPHIWCGVSAENNELLHKRLPDLLQAKCSVRFLSCEPLLGLLNLSLLGTVPKDWGYGYRPVHDLLHWVIAGGESGRDARPMHPEWVVSLRDQCAAAGTAFFFKQWGEWAPEMQQSGYVVNSKIKRRIVIPIGESKAADSAEEIDAVCSNWGGQSPRLMQRIGKHEARNFIMGQQYLEFPNQ